MEFGWLIEILVLAVHLLPKSIMRRIYPDTELANRVCVSQGLREPVLSVQEQRIRAYDVSICNPFSLFDVGVTNITARIVANSFEISTVTEFPNPEQKKIKFLGTRSFELPGAPTSHEGKTLVSQTRSATPPNAVDRLDAIVFVEATLSTWFNTEFLVKSQLPIQMLLVN
jgi:hypothetical protein